MTLFEKRLRFDHESNNQISISQTDFVVTAFIVLSVERYGKDNQENLYNYAFSIATTV